MSAVTGLSGRWARRRFNASREAFYADFAEAIDDGDSTTTYFESVRDFLLKNQRNSQADIYALMLARMEEDEGRISHMLKGIVVDDDLLALRAIDESVSESARAESLRFLANSIKQRRKMAATVLKACVVLITMTPIIVAFACFISIFFVPEYEKVTPHTSWPAVGVILYWISQAIRHFGFLILGICAVAGFAFKWSFANWAGTARVKVDRYLPYRLYRDYTSANFLVALAAMLMAKKSLVDALHSLNEQATPWLSWHITKILRNMDDDPDDYAKAFNTGLLSPEIHLRLSNYARRTSFSEGLMKLGTEGMVHVQEGVEKSGFKINLVATFASVAILLFFYGGNLLIGNSVRSQMKADASMQSIGR